jgi:hypothetical protein
MSYTGHVEKGVVVFDGPRPPEGVTVRVEEVPAATSGPAWAEVLKDLIGSVEGPEDLAENHDHYVHRAPRK